MICPEFDVLINATISKRSKIDKFISIIKDRAFVKSFLCVEFMGGRHFVPSIRIFLTQISRLHRIAWAD